MDETLTSSEAADKVRTYRMFSGIASAVLGLEPDQNYASEDAYIGAPSGAHIVADPYRGAVVQGTTRSATGASTGVRTGFVVTPVMIMVGLGLWWFMSQGKKG